MTTTNINNKTVEHFIREMDAALDIGDWQANLSQANIDRADLSGAILQKAELVKTLRHIIN
ncbi:MAG: pentapeptide repeat-containing protein [Microcoleus sp. SU_5_6]|nr:pentapeptide repeat-containing protein [Microcoleus sp. SU_5_6]NJL67004.1 pentapeptide repeat-containing protein [Microcoleus sp. SM1_3_4]